MASLDIDAAEQARSRQRWTWITIAAVGIVSGSALLAVPALAAEGSTGSGGTTDRVIVCESGVVTDGDVQTSSAVATRATSDAPVPNGCREG